MKKVLFLSLFLTTLSSSVLAYDYNEKPRYKRGKEQIIRDGSYNDMAMIRKVTPQYETINKPVEVCRKQIVQEVQQLQPVDNGSGSSTNYTGAIIGGVAGGILGNQVGGGRGKDLATAAGVITGALVGNNIAGKNNQAPQPLPSQQVIEKEKLVCEMENKYEKIATGYIVEYSYNGKILEGYTKQEPIGDRISVNVKVDLIQ